MTVEEYEEIPVEFITWTFISGGGIAVTIWDDGDIELEAGDMDMDLITRLDDLEEIIQKAKLYLKGRQAYLANKS